MLNDDQRLTHQMIIKVIPMQIARFLNALKISLITIALFSSLAWLAADEIMKVGAERGRWTMDFEAAKKLAAEHQLAIFIDFTGSDWCGWCKMMHGAVFSKPEWTEYARNKLALVTIDFPRTAGVVPDHYKARNGQLQKKYGVTGYPTYIILDSDGQTQLGRMGAMRDTTVNKFKQKVNDIIRFTQGNAQSFAKALSPESAKSYVELIATHQKTNKDLEQWLKTKPVSNPENQNQYLQFTEAIAKLQSQIESIEAEHVAKSLPADKAAAFLALNSELQKARQELQVWLRTHPMSPENRQQYQQFQAKIDELAAKKSAF
jgi:protein disulfide-isomerase